MSGKSQTATLCQHLDISAQELVVLLPRFTPGRVRSFRVRIARRTGRRMRSRTCGVDQATNPILTPMVSSAGAGRAAAAPNAGAPGRLPRGGRQAPDGPRWQQAGP